MSTAYTKPNVSAHFTCIYELISMYFQLCPRKLFHVPELPFGRRLYYPSVDGELGDVCVRPRGGELRAHGAHPWRHSLRYELRSVRCQRTFRHFTTTSRRLLGNSGSSRFVKIFTQMCNTYEFMP